MIPTEILHKTAVVQWVRAFTPQAVVGIPAETDPKSLKQVVTAPLPYALQ